MDSHRILPIDDVLFLMVEGALDQSGMAYIQNWLLSGPDALEHYFMFIKDYVAMKYQVCSMIYMEGDSVMICDEFDVALWAALAEVERVSESLPRQDQSSEIPALIERFNRPTTQPSKAKKSTLAFLILSSVVLVLFALILPFPGEIEVATLINNYNAKWSDPKLAVQNCRFSSNSETLVLHEGVAEVLFDNNALVTIEGPASFEILTVDHIRLNYGKIYATVPIEASGFQVITPQIKIIDLGTEFGVFQEADGDTELHVIIGKTKLVSVDGSIPIDVYVESGQAKRLNALSGILEQIPVKNHFFVRGIDTRSDSLWRGPAAQSPLLQPPAFLTTLKKVDDFEDADGNCLNDITTHPSGVLGGRWLTYTAGTTMVQFRNGLGGLVMSVANLRRRDGHSEGRSALIYGINKPIAAAGKGVLFFRFKSSSQLDRYQNNAFAFVGLSDKSNPTILVADINAGFGITGLAGAEMLDIIRSKWRLHCGLFRFGHFGRSMADERTVLGIKIYNAALSEFSGAKYKGMTVT